MFRKISELEQLQNEKRKALLEHETAKLRECDEALQRELRDWKSQLHPRKQVFHKCTPDSINDTPLNIRLIHSVARR